MNGTSSMNRTTVADGTGSRNGTTLAEMIGGSVAPSATRVATGTAVTAGYWELAWDSVWENPDTVSAAELNGALHPAPGDLAHVEPLSMRIYIAR